MDFSLMLCYVEQQAVSSEAPLQVTDWVVIWQPGGFEYWRDTLEKLLPQATLSSMTGG